MVLWHPAALAACCAHVQSEEAEKATRSMLTNCSENKVLGALLSLVNHKNANIRARTAVWVDRYVAHMGPRVSERPRLQ